MSKSYGAATAPSHCIVPFIIIILITIILLLLLLLLLLLFERVVLVLIQSQVYVVFKVTKVLLLMCL